MSRTTDNIALTASCLWLSTLLAACTDEPVLEGQVEDSSSTAGLATGGPTSSTDLAITFQPIDLDTNPNLVTHFEFIPNSNELLVITRFGRFLHYRFNGDSTTLLGKFTIPGLNTERDCGLVSFALDPHFEDNHFLYTGYCLTGTESVVMRFEFNPNAYDDIVSSGVEIMRTGDASTPRAGVHSVGKMGFDADENLWVLFGEKDVPENAQDLTTPLGSLVRLRPGAAGGYQPPDPPNPELADEDASNLIYAYGFRSPWTGTLDSFGHYWVGDVGSGGDDSFEEVNVVTAPGQNFGWPLSEGPCTGSGCATLRDPASSWKRRPISEFELEDPEVVPANNRVAWVGVEYPELGNDQYNGLMTHRVLYGDLCLGFVRALKIDEMGNVLDDRHVGHLAGASAWRIGPDGYIYASTYNRCVAGGDGLPPGQLMRVKLAGTTATQANQR